MKQEKSKRSCPIICRVLYAAALICVGLHVSFYLRTDFADWFNENVSAIFRTALSKLTSFLPFSLGEAVIICLPCAFIVLIIKSVVILRGDDEKKSNRLICSLLAFLCFLYSLFVMNFASAYRGVGLASKLSLERKDVSAEQLYSTGVYFNEKIKEELDDIDFDFASSKMPYSLYEMSDKLNEAYAKVADKYPFVQRLDCPVKFVALSRPMAYTHISGLYTYYTGEANINIDFPEYTIPYTAAHEMSHQRGTAAEDEANFMAFLVCENSSDPYIRYSGYISMFEYVSSALYSADRELYLKLWEDVDIRVKYEEKSYSEYFSKISDSLAAKATDVVNDVYLKSQGQSAGTKTYGLVVDLAVSYVENRT